VLLVGIDWAERHHDVCVMAAGGHPQQVWAMLNLAVGEASTLNHTWIGPDHLGLGLLHPNCPGVAGAVLESFGARLEPLRQAFIDSMGDPTTPR
jgi:hypothetical protein